jgi:uncharacterized RDD family membrane protein YckC
MTDPSQPGVPPGYVTLMPDQPSPGTAPPPDSGGPLEITGPPEVAGSPEAAEPPPGPPPAGITVPGVTAVTGRRVAAALIDITVLLGLLVILSQVVRRTSPDMGGGIRASIKLVTITRSGHPPVDIGLYGVWAALFWAIILAYYFVLEAWAGQTVGKALLGLRVARGDGRRAGLGAVAGRTLLRAIDGLPMLYLVGYVSVLVTGKRRARLGDLAAGTAVTRAQPAHPARHRAAAAAGLVAVLAAAVALPTYRLTSPGGPQVYRAHGVSFTYPAALQQVPAGDLRDTRRGAGTIWIEALGLGPNDLIFLEALPQDPPVTTANFASFAPHFSQGLRHYMTRAGWAVQAGPERTTMGGMPVVEAWVSGGTPHGAAVHSLEIYAYRGAIAYHLVCQHNPGQTRQVTQACTQVMATFTAAGVPPRPAGGASATPLSFRSDAQAVCQQTMRRIPSHPPRGRTSPAQFAAAFSRLAAVLGRMLARFASVEARAAWQYPFGEFLAHTGQLRDAVASVAQHLGDRDLAGARRQWPAARAAMSQIRRDAPWLSTHGLGPCTMLSQLG